MKSIDAAELRYDLGVLFVHGIGQSKQGQTLLSCGEPLREAIERLAQPSGADAPGATVPAAWLSDPADRDPARAELLVHGAGEGSAGAAGPSRWLLAEAWWAEKFPTPTFTEIAAWSFGVLPATLIAHADRRFRRVAFRYVAALRDGGAVAEVLGAIGRLLAEGVRLTAALSLTPALLLAIAALLVLGLPPFAATRNLAGALQRLLAGTIGDSYVFMQQPITAAAITTAVRERLEWLAARCRRVAVVAHSQGAAVAHRVLRGAVTAPCDLFVSYGSGLAKLSEATRGETTRGSSRLWYATFGSVLGAVALALLTARGWKHGGVWGLADAAARALLVVEFGTLALLAWLTRIALRPTDAAGAVADGVPASAAATTVPEGASLTASPARSAPAAAAYVAPAAASAAATRVRLLLLPLAFAAATGAVAALPWRVEALDLALALQMAVALGLAAAFTGLAAWHGESLRAVDPAWQWQRDRELFAREFRLGNRPYMNWYDLFASADPVPNGALLDDFEPKGLLSIEVSNRGSMLVDHTSYWQSRDDFVPRAASLLLRLAGLRVRDLDTPRSTRRRRWRVGWLAAARGLVLLSTLAQAVQWTLNRPPLLDRAWNALAASTPAQAEPGPWAAWRDQALPALAALLLGLLALGAMRLAWQRWDRDELAIFQRRGDHALAPPGLWLTLLAPLAVAALAITTFGGGSAAIAAGAAAGFLAAVATVWPALRAALCRVSQSGTPAELDALARASLRRRHAAARQRRDVRALTDIGRRAQGLDDALAREALQMAAFDLQSANAAWALGRLFETAAGRARDDAARQTARDAAIAAYAQGAALGDRESAWWGACLLDKDGQDDAALAMYRRALALGDAGSAHALGLRLMQRARADPALRDRAREVYEQGVARGDALSMDFLAGHLESLAREARDKEGSQAAAALMWRAIELYRRAFDAGHVPAATQAGHRLRELGQTAAARAAFERGMRLRDTAAALALGDLERDDEQDDAAARRAYREAIALDDLGAAAAQALLALGGLLERQGRPAAAVVRYREALAMPRNDEARADAALALARLLEARDLWRHRDEITQALQRAVTLAPRRAAGAWVEFIARQHDHDAAVALGEEVLSALTAHGLAVLAQLLRIADPERARAALERGFALGPGASGAEEVAAALLQALWLASDNEGLRQAMATTQARGAWFAGRVADALREQRSNWLADQLLQGPATPAPP